jgi:hypothetical protein
MLGEFRDRRFFPLFPGFPILLIETQRSSAIPGDRLSRTHRQFHSRRDTLRQVDLVRGNPQRQSRQQSYGAKAGHSPIHPQVIKLRKHPPAPAFHRFFK